MDPKFQFEELTTVFIFSCPLTIQSVGGSGSKTSAMTDTALWGQIIHLLIAFWTMTPFGC